MLDTIHDEGQTKDPICVYNEGQSGTQAKLQSIHNYVPIMVDQNNSCRNNGIPIEHKILGTDALLKLKGPNILKEDIVNSLLTGCSNN